MISHVSFGPKGRRRPKAAACWRFERPVTNYCGETVKLPKPTTFSWYATGSVGVEL
jgi:hypothetical protein